MYCYFILALPFKVTVSPADSHYGTFAVPGSDLLRPALSLLWCCLRAGFSPFSAPPHPLRGSKAHPELSSPLSRSVLGQHFPWQVSENNVFCGQKNLGNSASWTLPKHFLMLKALRSLHKETNLILLSQYF